MAKELREMEQPLDCLVNNGGGWLFMHACSGWGLCTSALTLWVEPPMSSPALREMLSSHGPTFQWGPRQVITAQILVSYLYSFRGAFVALKLNAPIGIQ
jgi:hypothetical protein